MDHDKEINEIKRRLTMLTERRALSGDRINVLSDRLAGVEHRVNDIYRVTDEHTLVLQRMETRLSAMEATNEVILNALDKIMKRLEIDPDDD